MVCFECSKCNETVKKPKLAMHLLKCQSQLVTCIDCNMRFNWDDWEHHTSCVSEAQKYQGHLFQAKENTNKGQVKQDNWTDNIMNKIEDPSSGVSPQTKGLLTKLMGFTNVPRKPKPFANFVKNSLKIWDEKRIDDMWQVIFTANEKAKPAAPEAGASTKEAAQPSAGKPAKRKWEGWKKAVDEELEAQDGQLTWRKLRDMLVARYRAEAQNVNGQSNEDLGWQALASISDEYLSSEDALVRLPPARKKQR